MQFLKNYIEDLFIFLGMFLIVLATLLISEVLAMYVLGTFFLFLGGYLSRNLPKKGG